MKKIVVGVVAVLALVAAGMPFVSGMVMEKGFRQCVENFNAMNAGTGADLRLQILRYERGFSSSEVEWKISLGSLKTLYGIEEILFTDRAEHGYTGVVSTTSLAGNSWYTDFVNERLGGTTPFAMTTEYTLTGDIRSVLSLKPFSLQMENETLESKSGQLVVECDWKLEQFRSSGSWEGFTASDTLSMTGVSFGSDLRMISSFIWDGQAALQIDQVMAHDDTVSMEMENLLADYSVKYDGEKRTLAAEASYGVGRFSDGSEKVEHGAATIGFTGLDAVAYEEAMRLYMDLVSTMMAEIAAAGEDQEKVMQVLEEQMNSISFQVMAVYEKFLKGGLEVYVRDLHAGVRQGEIQGDVVLRLEKDMTLAQMIPLMNQPERIFDYISLQSDLRLPAELAGDNPMLFEPLSPGMRTGLFVKKGAELVHRAETRDNKLFINGEELIFN